MKIEKERNNNIMALAEKIYTLRKERNFSQEQLAEKLNVSRQSVSKWESGQALPEIDKIIELSKLFQITTDFLLLDSSDTKKNTPFQLSSPEEQGDYPIQVRNFSIWHAIFAFVVVLAVFCFMGCYLFLGDFGWFALALLIASAAAIHRYLSIKEKYLNTFLSENE